MIMQAQPNNKLNKPEQGEKKNRTKLKENKNTRRWRHHAWTSFVPIFARGVRGQ